MRDLLTIKEYAQLKGVSTQAVYKRIKKGNINTYHKTENGKEIIYIEIDAPTNQIPTPDANPQPTKPTGCQPTKPTGCQPTPERPEQAKRNDCQPTPDGETTNHQPTPDANHQPTPDANHQPTPDDTIAFYQEIIREKDRQLAEKDKQIANKDKQISDLTRLLDQQQTLQAAQARLMISSGSEEAKQTEPAAAIIQEQPQEPKKKGFWAWLKMR